MIACGASVLLNASAEAETWLCKQPDGSDLFSNYRNGTDCVQYFPKSELGKSGAIRQPDRDSYPQAPIDPNARPRDDAAAPVPGDITFEQFRMLSTGMTEGQVLAKIGTPASKATLACMATNERLSPQDRVTTVTCPSLWTYTMSDGWTADLTFASGRLVDIQNTKTP
jgi:hypothetical protein